MFLNLANKKETSVRKMLETINAARNAEDLEQIRQAWRKQQQFDNMTLLAAERVYAIKGKGLAQQYKHLTSPAWFRSWKQNHPGSCSDDVLPPSSPQLLPRIFPHPSTILPTSVKAASASTPLPATSLTLWRKRHRIRYLQNLLSGRNSPQSENFREDGNLEVTMQPILKIKLTQ